MPWISSLKRSLEFRLGIPATGSHLLFRIGVQIPLCGALVRRRKRVTPNKNKIFRKNIRISLQIGPEISTLNTVGAKLHAWLGCGQWLHSKTTGITTKQKNKTMSTPQSATTTTTTASSTPKLPLVEKLDMFKTAWITLAPQNKFASMTFSEFVTGTLPSLDIRASMACHSASIKAGISSRNHADKATRALINRVVAGVKADAVYGPDCALYRAMGFTPTSERKSPAPVDPAAKTAKAAHVPFMDRFDKMVSAWTEFAQNASFAGMTLEGFKQAAESSVLARSSIESAKTNLKGGIALRKAADAVTLDLLNRVVSSVKGEAGFGNDCPLYRALGYKPASERRSAKRTAATHTAIATPAAA